MIIREAALYDSLDIFAWRNDPVSRSMSVGGGVVNLKEHEYWFHDSLTNPLRKLYVGVITEGKVGVCRFDYSEATNCADVSININPCMRGKNLSQGFLLHSITAYREGRHCQLNARVRKHNLASIKIFQKNNFIQHLEDDNFYFFKTSE
jgi:hypothetical protein